MDQTADTTNSVQADLGQLPMTGPMSAQQYEVLLDLNYVADRQWERVELMRQIEQLRVEQIRRQQMSRGSAQTVRMHEPPLQNSAAIGPLNDDARQPGLVMQSQHSVYMPMMELADKRQLAACSNLALLNCYMPLGMHMSELTCCSRRCKTSMCTLQRQCAKCTFSSLMQQHVSGIIGDMTSKWQ